MDTTLFSMMRQRWFGTFILIAVTTTLAACGGRRSDQYRTQGDTYFGLGKHAEAAESYSRAVEADATNALAKVGLGRCLALQGKTDEAMTRYKEAMAVRPPVYAAYAEAVSLLLDEGKSDEAKALVETLGTSDEILGALLEASLLLRLDRPGEAVSLLSAARERHPASDGLAVALAVALIAAGDPTQAEGILREVLQRASDATASARMALVLAAKSQGKAGELAAEWESLAQEGDESVKLAYACSLVAAGQVEEGNAIVQAALQKDPGSAWANYAAAQVFLARNSAANVDSQLRIATAKRPEDPVIAWVAARSHQQSDAPVSVASEAREGGASATSSRSTTYQPEDWRGLWSKGALGTFLQERATFRASSDAAVIEHLLVAALILGRGDVVDELMPAVPSDSSFRKCVEVMKSKNPEALRDFLQEWKEEEPERKLLQVNAQAAIIAGIGGRDAAAGLINATQKEHPDDGALMFNFVQILRSAGANGLALHALQRLIDMHPDNIDAHSLRFALLRQTGKRSEALEAAETAYALFPSETSVSVELAQAYLDSNNASLADTVLTKARQNHPDLPELVVAHALVLLHMNRPQEVAPLFEASGTQVNSGNPMVIAAMAAAMSDDWNAVIDLGKNAKETPLPLPHWLLYVGGHVRNSTVQEAAASLERKGSTGGRESLIVSLVAKAAGLPAETLQPDQATLAEGLASKPDVLVRLTRALAAQVMGLHSFAYGELKKAGADLPPSLPLLALTLTSLPQATEAASMVSEARALIQPFTDNGQAWLALQSIAQVAGDMETEREALQKAVERAPNDPAILFQRGLLAERENQPARAVPEYRRMLEIQPDNPAANNNLAYCLLQVGEDLPEALAMAEKAAKALPGDPNVLHTLGVAQLRAGKLEESKRNLAVALQLRPVEPTLLLDYGQLLVAQGAKDEGLAHIRMALEYADRLGLEFPRRAEAETAIQSP